MIRSLLRILSRNAVAWVALFVALGGTSLALSQSAMVQRGARARAAAATGVTASAWYVVVNTSGTMNAAQSNAPGVILSNPKPGLFCFTGFTTPPNAVIASIGPTKTAGGTKVWAGPLNTCPSTTQATVETISGRGLQGAPFAAAFFYNQAAAAVSASARRTRR
jgi:hypothetical protein